MFNWSFIILSALRILEIKIWGKILAIIGIILILAAISGTLMEKSIRMGFFVSLIVVVIIGIVALIMQKKVWRKEKSSLKSFCKLIIDKSRIVFFIRLFPLETLGQGFIAGYIPLHTILHRICTSYYIAGVE